MHEDDELLVGGKPADLVCHPTKGDEYSGLMCVRLPGQADVHGQPARRETTGIVLLAKRDGQRGTTETLGKWCRAKIVRCDRAGFACRPVPVH